MHGVREPNSKYSNMSNQGRCRIMFMQVDIVCRGRWCDSENIMGVQNVHSKVHLSV